MATDIVQSLFGVTPDMYQQQQARQADARALQFAQLTPMQQAQYGIGRGAYGLAGAIGGALGAQDPELQMVSQRNAIAKQIDPTDPESMRRGIQALVQSGDTVGGLQLTEVLRKLESEMAQSFQRRAAGTASLAQAARERAAPPDLQKADEIARLVGALETPELTEMERRQIQARLNFLNPPEKLAATAPGVQEAAEIGRLTAELQKIDPTDPRRLQIQAQLDALKKTASVAPDIQKANEIGRLTVALQATDLTGPQRLQIQAQLDALKTTAAIAPDIQKANELAQIVAELEAPGLTDLKKRQLQARLTSLSRPPEKAETVPPELQKARRVAQITLALETPEISPLEKRQLEAELKSLSPVEPKPAAEAASLQLASAIEGAQATVDALTNLPAGPERDDALRRATTRLNALERQLPQPKQSRGVVKEIGIAKNTGAPVFLDDDGQFVYKDVDGKQTRTPYSGAIETKTANLKVENVIPGVKPVFDTAAMRARVQDTIKPQIATITATEQALQSINDSINTNNFVSFNAARTQLAKSLGDSQLSRRDIEQAGGDPSILGGLIDVTSKAFTSTPGLDTQRKIRDTLQAINRVATRQAKEEIDTQREIALRSPGADPAAINRALMFPQLQGRPAPPAAGGDLAAQAAAELARRRGGK
jgi:hypothetical protein